MNDDIRNHGVTGVPGSRTISDYRINGNVPSIIIVSSITMRIIIGTLKVINPLAKGIYSKEYDDNHR